MSISPARCVRATPSRRELRQESSQDAFKSATFVAILRGMGIRGRLAESIRAFAQAFRSPELRRLQLAGAGSTLAVWAYSIAIAVYAYREDGAGAVGIVLFVRWSLAAVFAPWLALFADRVSRRRVMLSVDLSRVALVGSMTVVAVAGGPSLVTYALAVVMSVISTAFGPAQAALLPSLAATPEELTASNLALNTIASVGMFAGPAIGGVILAFSGPWLVFALAGVSYLWSAVCVLGLPRDAPPERTGEHAIGSELLAGFRAIGEDRHLQVVIGLTGAQMFVAGALEVVIVVDAIRVLHAGNSGVGWLNTALGVGGLLGGLVGVVLTARKRLAGDFRLGLAVFGVALVAARDLEQLRGCARALRADGHRQHARRRHGHDAAAAGRAAERRRPRVRRAPEPDARGDRGRVARHAALDLAARAAHDVRRRRRRPAGARAPDVAEDHGDRRGCARRRRAARAAARDPDLRAARAAPRSSGSRRSLPSCTFPPARRCSSRAMPATASS